jgi:hypothetical protein
VLGGEGRGICSQDLKERRFEARNAKAVVKENSVLNS